LDKHNSDVTKETPRSRLVTPENLVGEDMPAEKRMSRRVHHCCESLVPEGFRTLIGPVQVPARHLRMAQDTIQYLVLHRCDPSCNMARYYVLAIKPSLFGNPTLIREWGRIGLPGQRRVELHKNQSQAVEALETWLQRKRRRGYELRDGVTAGADQTGCSTCQSRADGSW
jgi:predicted DNA-binding WGR domain protein